MNIKKISLILNDFYDSINNFNTQKIVDSYKEPILNEHCGNIEEIKNILDEILNDLKWNMTAPPKDYIENKINESIDEDDDSDEYFLVFIYPFFLYNEEFNTSFEFYFSKENSELVRLKII